jgi:DNA helicase-4
VEDAKADYVVGTDQFAKPVRIVPGPVWASLEIETRTGKRQLRGFREREVRQVADALNATLNREARNRIFASQVRVSAAAASIEALLGSQRYVRQSDGAACMNQVGSLTDTVMHPSWDSWANESQRAQAWIVRRFIAHTAEDIARANELFMKSEFDRYSEFFDTIESSALTAAQRRACIAMERSNLVLAGAGTGKTSTMIGRAGYLIASSQAVPHQILMLAYGRKAAQEMQERQDKRLAGLCAGATPKIKTFHALGLEIIGAVEGKVPAITVMAEDSAVLDRFINDEMARQCLNPEYVSDVVRWCLGKQFSYSNPFDFDSEDEYEEYVESTELRTLQGELVKSHEELAIANFLYANRIQYLYESPYPIDLADQTHRRYTPDFYLSDYDIYLEHFALNRDMQAPAGWDGYLEGVIWKRQVHQTHGTRLLETRSHMQTEGALEQYLKESLTSVGVELDPLPAEVLLDELRSRGRLQYITKPFREFLTLLKDSAIELHSVRVMASDLPDAGRFELFFLLFEPILEAYESALADAGEVDFGDMIKRAVEYVETGRYQSPFTHILVDEFQDISASRSKLVKALLGQREDAVLFAVGDDWQSIYRFTGSDISLTRDFPAHFGATATTALDKTFRFNDRIGSVSSTFVQRNPSQLSKSIHSVASAGEPCVSLVPVRDRAYALDMCMTAIEQRAAAAGMERASVLVLARYGYVLDNWSSESRARMAARFPGLTVDFMTAHASKGREADFVVILGMEGGTNGFPAQKRPEPLHELLLPRPEEYPNAEERRLFYVTLTRARHRVYVLFEQDKPSDFVRELADRQSRYDVCTDEFANFAGGAAYLDEAPCPGCKRGHLVSRNGPTGEFVGCSRYPRCGYMESACRACGSPMRRADGKRVCTNAACDCVEPTCPECGAAMVRRKGKWGAFWGCANYKGDEAGSCRGKVKIEKR